jgi:hypothetical protein
MKSSITIDVDKVVVQKEDLLTSELDGDTVLMSMTQAAYYGLDLTAQRIWNMIAQPHRVADLCEQLIADYDVDRATCEQHVCTFLTELNKEGLIRVIAEDGS